MIDFILGGYDYFYVYSYINGIYVLRLGVDFKQLSYIELRWNQDLEGMVKKWDVDIVWRDIV